MAPMCWTTTAAEERRPLSPCVKDIIASRSSIHLAGHCRDTVAAYGLADVIVLPTYREGLPNVARDAAAMARPIVATWSTGYVEVVVHGYSGTLVPVRMAAALTEALARYMDHPALRLAQGAFARQRVQSLFSRSEVIAGI